MLTAPLMATRARKMFVVGTSGPSASGLSALAKQPTKEIVLLVFNVINEWTKADIDALSDSFGNFDRVVAQGWLLGDALGMLLTHTDAYALGCKVRHHAGKIAGEIAGVRRAAKMRFRAASCTGARQLAARYSVSRRRVET